MKSTHRIRDQARRIYDHYRPEEIALLKAMELADWYDLEKIRRIADIQKRRALAGRVLEMGLY